jgi:hypothetical protein
LMHLMASISTDEFGRHTRILTPFWPSWVSYDHHLGWGRAWLCCLWSLWRKRSLLDSIPYSLAYGAILFPRFKWWSLVFWSMKLYPYFRDWCCLHYPAVAFDCACLVGRI